MTAAKQGDPVLGLDVHLCMVPMPAPTPFPVPHPFVGVVLDIFGALLGSVRVNGCPPGNTMTGAMGPPHIPVFPRAPADPPGLTTSGDILTGSLTVHFEGSSMGRELSSVKTCGYPIDMPTSVVLPIAHGAPVLIGGPEACDNAGAIKAALFGLATSFAGKVLKKVFGKVFRRAACWLGGKLGGRVGNAIKTAVGDPVDVVSGEMISEAVDFELGGAIMPLVWERNYRSREGVHPTLPVLHKKLRTRTPALGPAWFHPFETWIEEEDNGIEVHVRHPDGRALTFETLMRPGAEVFDPIDRLTLKRTQHGYELVEQSGKRWLYREATDMPRRAGPRLLLPIAVQDTCDNRIDLHHERGYLRYVVDAAGRVLDVRWNAQGRMESVWFTGFVTPRTGDLSAAAPPRPPSDVVPLDRAECLVRYAYEAGHLTAATDALGQSQTYRWSEGVIIEKRDKRGLAFFFAWDFDHPDGDCIRTWGEDPSFDPSAAADNPIPKRIIDRRIDYWKERHLTVVEDGRGAVTQYFTNDLGLVDKEVGPQGEVTETTWSEYCWKLAEKNPLGHETTWRYDARGRLIEVTNPLGEKLRYAYDAQGNRTEATLPDGGLMTAHFDRRRLPVTLTNPAGDVTRIAYDERGLPTGVQDPMGRATALAWSERHDLRATTDGEARVTERTHDRSGRLVGAVDPMGRRLRVERDALGRATRIEDFGGKRAELTYDAEDNVVERVDELGRRVRMRYAGLDNLVEHIDPMGYRVRLRYDTETDLVAVTNQLGEEYRFELDVAGRVTREATFSGHKRLYLYDKAGRTSRVVSDWGRVTQITRDKLGRVVETVASGGERRALLGKEKETFSYDAMGRLTAATCDGVAVELERDLLGRVVAERAGELEVQSAYDRSGLRTKRSTSLLQESTYAYNLAGDLMGMSTEWGGLGMLGQLGLPQARMGAFEVKFARDRNGEEIARRLPGGVSAVWTRDAFGKPLEQRIVTGARADRAGTDVMRKGYAWNGPDQIGSITDYDPASGTPSGGSAFQYDPRGHLVRQLFSNGEVLDRASDPAGNLFRSADRGDRIYGRGGVLKKAGGTTYTFDADGYLSEKVLSDGAKWTYSWTPTGRLREVTRPDGKKVAFGYDALGRRVRKEFDGRLTEFVWDGNDLVHERTTEAGGEKMPLVTWLFEPGTFSPVAKVEGRKRYGMVSDHLGVPTALMTEAGKIAWQAQLDVYGVMREDMPVGGAAAEKEERTGNPWRLPGQYEDAETGLFYNRFRYYDPEIGRYISEDPIGLAGGAALFAYPADPKECADPFGLSCIRNKHLANSTHPVTGVPFDADGFPVFDKWRHPDVADVRITLTGNRIADFAAANKLANLLGTPDGFTWHHHQDKGLMQLIDSWVHSKTGHTGGFSL